jgi:hypothetical protein
MSRGVRISVRMIAVVAAAIALARGSQDASDADRRAVTVAAERLQRAFAAGDVHELCARMTRSAAKQAGEVVHGTPEACEPDMRRAFKVLGMATWVDAGRLSLHDVDVDGDNATVSMARGSQRIDVPLVRDGERWKLDSFFGTSPAKVDNKPSPLSAAGDGVAATRASGDARKKCGDFFGPYPTVLGGCELYLWSSGVEISILTPFGGFRFARCQVSFRLLIDGDGRTWTREITIEGGPDDGCGDVEPCEKDDDPLPWKGRISAGSGGVLVHRVDVCLDTCIGYYEGELVTRLARRNPGWRVVAADASVGQSGFTLRGRLSTDDDSLSVRAL